MAILSRKALQASFAEGDFLTSGHFEHLIDSTVNKVDDAWERLAAKGWVIQPLKNQEAVLTLQRCAVKAAYTWRLKQEGEQTNLYLYVKDKLVYRINSEGQIGFGAENTNTRLSVSGGVSFDYRQGAWAQGEIHADGTWHRISPVLNDMHVLEVVASVRGAKATGQYALFQGVAMTCFGKNKIRGAEVCYNGKKHRIEARWNNDPAGVVLELRTRNTYDLIDNAIPQIHYNICKLGL